MKRSNRLILLVGVLLALVAAVGVILLLGQNRGGSGPQTPPAQLDTVFATKDLPLGTVITQDMIETKKYDVAKRDAGAFNDSSLVLGKVTRQNVVTGQQLTPVVFSAAAGVTQIDTPPGTRAIAIQVDQTSGVGTVIRAGDYVDLLVGMTGDKFPVVTTNPQNPAQVQVVQGLSATSVKLLLQGMQVLGTLLPPPSAAQQQQQQQQQQQGQTPQQTTNLTGQQEIVIVAATPQQAEVIKFAQLDGSISLVLRSAQEFQQRDENGKVIPPAPDSTTGIILRSLIDQYGVLVPELVEANARNLTTP